MSQSDSLVTASVIDLTRKLTFTANGEGSGTGEGITAGRDGLNELGGTA